MAVIWQKRSRDKLYEVRRAGASTRLYTNGIFHSQFNPRQPITDNLWNMLALPAYFHKQPAAIKRGLVLGVGGGAVMRHIMRLSPDAAVFGVDLDGTHLKVAERFFGVKGENVRLIHAEAVQWINNYQGQTFDFIVDDLFGETTDAQQLPERAVPLTGEWLCALERQLAPDGVLAFNLESEGQWRKLRQCTALNLPGRFAQLTKITHPRYLNAVAALLPQSFSAAQLRQALTVEPVYQRWMNRGGLPFGFSSQFQPG